MLGDVACQAMEELNINFVLLDPLVHAGNYTFMQKLDHHQMHGQGQWNKSGRLGSCRTSI